MTSHPNHRPRRAGDESGFTLVELLIITVVLGILATIVTFSLLGVSGEASVSACSADSKTVVVAANALTTENPGVAFATSTDWMDGLLRGSTLNGAPFLQSWPNAAKYTVAIAGNGATATTGDSITPSNGDVIVTITQSGLTYDYTKDPAAACAAA